MKTLLVATLFSALVAFALMPVNFVVAVSLLFTAGLAAIIATDYTRTRRLVRLPLVAATLARRPERFGLAA